MGMNKDGRWNLKTYRSVLMNMNIIIMYILIQSDLGKTNIYGFFSARTSKKGGGKTPLTTKHKKQGKKFIKERFTNKSNNH